MSAIPINLDLNNSERIMGLILKAIGKEPFNLLVETLSLGETEPKLLKFCNKKILGGPVYKDGQAGLKINSSQSISWDLNVEQVQVTFEANGDVLICRFFNNRSKRKLMKITKSFRVKKNTRITKNPI